MSAINISLVRKLINFKNEIELINTFLEDFKDIDEFIHDYKWLENVNKIPKLNKHKKDIIAFVDKYHDILQKFIEADILYEMTHGFEINYHWEDTYSLLLNDIQKLNENKVLNILDFFEQNKFDEVIFEKKDFNKIYYEEIKKSFFNKDEYSLRYCFSDGTKKYLARYYGGEYYPVIFENAKIILTLHNNFVYHDRGKVLLNTFDIDLNKINFTDNVDEIINSIPFENIEVFSQMCKYLVNINKNIRTLESNKKILESMSDNKDLHNFSESQLKDLNIQLENLKNQEEAIYKEYLSLGYEESFIEKSVDYLQEAERQSYFDYH